MTTMEPTQDSKERFAQVFDRIERVCGGDTVIDNAAKIAKASYSAAVTSVFNQEGNLNPWASLSPVTAEERRKMGFGGEHPILRRSNTLLRSLTDESLSEGTYLLPASQSQSDSIRSGFVSEITFDVGSGDLVFVMGTADERFVEMQEGGGNVPARPMLPTGTLLLSTIKEIEQGLLALVRKEAGAP
jgi:hypothetical protein